MSSLNSWTNSNNASVCADATGNSTWDTWDASQRDLFVLDHAGDVVLHQNITSGLPNNLESVVINLINEIPDDCDPSLGCGEAITCCDGLLYSTTCCSDNCDEPIDTCSEDECIDGEVNNTNPCNPMECYNGQWVEIIIDCPEGFGIPCDGGIYISPPEGVCCSTCVQYGDTNNDSTINVVDIILLVNFILGNEIPNEDELVLGDMNGDGMLNVVDIIVLVNIILS